MLYLYEVVDVNHEVMLESIYRYHVPLINIQWCR